MTTAIFLWNNFYMFLICIAYCKWFRFSIALYFEIFLVRYSIFEILSKSLHQNKEMNNENVIIAIDHYLTNVRNRLYWIVIPVYLLSLQNMFVYPGLQPLSQSPVCLLQGAPCRHCPLQLLRQLIPKVLSLQAATKKTSFLITWIKDGHS